MNIWLNGTFEVPILCESIGRAVWLHRSTILGLAALDEAADTMVELCFV